MKKMMALVLVLLMVFSLAACGGGGEDGGSNSSNNSSTNKVEDVVDSGLGEVLAEGTAGPGKTDFTAASFYGFFDDTFDYTTMEKYEVRYVALSTGALYDAFSDAYELWAQRYNCGYDFIACNGDSDLLLQQMEVLAGQGVKGFFLDPDAQTLPRVTELAQELVGDAWMSCMSSPVDADGKMNHPFVGFDNFQLGRLEGEYLINYALENWPEFDADKAVMINCDFSISPQFQQRGQGSADYWDEKYPGAEYINMDLISGMMTADDSYNEFSTVISQHPEFEYWLVAGSFDQYAIGCARAAEAYQIDDKTVITAIGGTELVNEWDNDQDSCWKGAIFNAQTLYGEPIFGAVYAMMAGWVTAEQLWPDFTNAESNGYGWIFLACQTIEIDNYKDYLEWVDWHSGFDYYKYEEYTGDGSEYPLTTHYEDIIRQ